MNLEEQNNYQQLVLHDNDISSFFSAAGDVRDTTNSAAHIQIFIYNKCICLF
jgi:hypothetical protein